MSIKKEFGLRLKEIRTQKAITQQELAEQVGIDPKHMSHIETGRSFPKADLIEKFSKALNVDYTYFFKTEHLRDRKYLLNQINIMLNNISDKELRKIFNLIQCCVQNIK